MTSDDHAKQFIARGVADAMILAAEKAGVDWRDSMQGLVVRLLKEIGDLKGEVTNLRVAVSSLKEMKFGGR